MSERGHFTREDKFAAVVADAYFALLEHPFDAWRAQNQGIYASLRDVLAEYCDLSAEEIQTNYEMRVAKKSERKAQA